MNQGFSHCLQIFPAPNLNKTAQFYEGIGFRADYYLESAEPHVCLYRDSIEIVLTKSKNNEIIPNRISHGYGYDAYFVSYEQKALEQELMDLGIKIVRPLSTTDYNNREFVFEDIDGRWIAVGNKL
ncbi:glyoxalase [Paenibacillus sp. N3/727]|uniref:VOC family protein n=1 Tax=Paenibacillus sp. N3/727 TaxID=2925845 RepID=UPI001F5301E7|nr:VOC family protein [Paenibacillus sp. N3/727]UNK16958.1 glyoxalase [Paenibacillus sp. N3/727]